MRLNKGPGIKVAPRDATLIHPQTAHGPRHSVTPTARGRQKRSWGHSGHGAGALALLQPHTSKRTRITGVCTPIRTHKATLFDISGEGREVR